jgi:heat shock protein HslJ
MRALMVPAAMLLMVGLTACGDDAAEQAGDPAADGNAPGIAIGNTGLPACEYLSTEVTENGKPRKLVKDTHISLTFREGQVHAQAGCNQMSGPARLEGRKLIVDDLAQTEMGCPGDGRYEQDTFVAQFLTARPAFTGGAEGYSLATAAVSMKFAPKSKVLPVLPLEGTRWDITHTTQGPARGAADDPNGAVSAGMAPQGAYLQFGDGKVTGSDGCNSLFGDAVITGDTIAFGPIGTTKKACPDSDVVPQARQSVLAALTGAVEWSIDHNVLHLETPSGAGLQLQAAQNAEDLPLKVGDSDSVTPPCCKPDATGGPVSGGSSGVNPATVESTGPNTGTGGGPTGY